jgi:aminopeptidase N
MNRLVLSILMLAILTVPGISQEDNKSGLLQHKHEEFSHQDTLRGSITKERAWWDLTYYTLDVKVNIDEKFISGENTIQYTVLESLDLMQIDLQEPMTIFSVKQDGAKLEFTREGNVYFIQLKKAQNIGDSNTLEILFEGNPRVAARAPWDGGFTWAEDGAGRPFVATSNQGLGASVWWPCKDHMYDEPEGMKINLTVASDLIGVANGRLMGVDEQKGSKTFHWEVENPINNYGVNVNIADYAHFSEVFEGEQGKLDCDYYVLKENLEKAKEHFKQATMMLEAFEHWFGPYPFYEDGFKLVEVPYLGMEHQSSVTYGNHYQNGYLGRDLSGSGWGLKFDFIIIHESGHEWFANSITYKDIADMWIHESFTNYSESLYVEYHYGKEAGDEYVRGSRRNILNDIPIIGIYDVNKEGSGDMYPKGANMLHTIRQILNDDVKWRAMLRDMNEQFYHTTVATADIEDYMIEYTGLDLQPIFNQYLRTTMIPTLEYYFSDGRLMYRWLNIVEGFEMPVVVAINGEEIILTPKKRWSAEEVSEGEGVLIVDSDFFVGSFRTR